LVATTAEYAFSSAEATSNFVLPLAKSFASIPDVAKGSKSSLREAYVFN
jgi:hypothetical protein